MVMAGKTRKGENRDEETIKKTAKRKGQRKVFKWSRDWEMINSETRYSNKLGEKHTP